MDNMDVENIVQQFPLNDPVITSGLNMPSFADIDMDGDKALFISGFNDLSLKILNIFKWGPHFLQLNKNALEDYANSSNEIEMKAIEKSYFGQLFSSN